MGASDVVLAALILAGAAYVLYRSLWKKKGHCQGCSEGACGSRDLVSLPRPPPSRRPPS